MIGPIGQFLPIVLPDNEKDESDNEIDPDVEMQETLEMIKELQRRPLQHTSRKRKKK